MCKRCKARSFTAVIPCGPATTGQALQSALHSDVGPCTSASTGARGPSPAQNTLYRYLKASRRSLTHTSAANPCEAFSASQCAAARTRELGITRSSGASRGRPDAAPTATLGAEPTCCHSLTSVHKLRSHPNTPCSASRPHTQPTAAHAPAPPHAIPAGAAARAQCGQRPAPQAHAAGGAIHEQMHAQVRCWALPCRSRALGWECVCKYGTPAVGMRVGAAFQWLMLRFVQGTPWTCVCACPSWAVVNVRETTPLGTLCLARNTLHRTSSRQCSGAIALFLVFYIPGPTCYYATHDSPHGTTRLLGNCHLVHIHMVPLGASSRCMPWCSCPPPSRGWRRWATGPPPGPWSWTTCRWVQLRPWEACVLGCVFPRLKALGGSIVGRLQYKALE